MAKSNSNWSSAVNLWLRNNIEGKNVSEGIKESRSKVAKYMAPYCHVIVIQEYQQGAWVQIWPAVLGEGLDSSMSWGVTTHRVGTEKVSRKPLSRGIYADCFKTTYWSGILFTVSFINCIIHIYLSMNMCFTCLDRKNKNSPTVV